MWSPYFFGASLAATELRLWSWRSTLVEICASKAALCATGRARTAADTNAVHDRLFQSMRVRFSDSEQWSSPVKPPRSQNYVKPHDARARACRKTGVVGLGDHDPGQWKARPTSAAPATVTRTR